MEIMIDYILNILIVVLFVMIVIMVNKSMKLFK